MQYNVIKTTVYTYKLLYARDTLYVRFSLYSCTVQYGYSSRLMSTADERHTREVTVTHTYVIGAKNLKVLLLA